MNRTSPDSIASALVHLNLWFVAYRWAAWGQVDSLSGVYLADFAAISDENIPLLVARDDHPTLFLVTCHLSDV